MRILTTAAQIRRVSGIEGTGDFPPYPYGDPIPQEVGQALLDGLSEISWHADRDFLSDDGGFVLIFDGAVEFSRCPFGLPAVTQMELIRRLDLPVSVITQFDAPLIEFVDGLPSHRGR